MKKISILLILFCSLISCERKQPNFSEKMIEKLAYMHEDVELGSLPSKYLTLDLYVNTNGAEIYRVNNHDLFLYYKKYYLEDFTSFEKFLDAVLNQGFQLNKKLIKCYNDSYCFRLNKKIEKEYSTLGFDKFLKKYSKESSRRNELELNKLIIKPEEYFTIQYLLYSNRYDKSSDCLVGRDYIRKREDSFK